MKIKLLDYNNQSFEYDIGELSDIIQIDLEIISGDEILQVVYKDNSTAMFDPAPERILDFNDGGYILYDKVAGINNLNDKNWLNREDSYSYP